MSMSMLFYTARHDVSRGFVFYFVTCPCSSRTKRHDNLFVDVDDDDAASTQHSAAAAQSVLLLVQPSQHHSTID